MTSKLTLHDIIKNKTIKIMDYPPDIHYKKFNFFQGSKPLKKVLKNLEKNYFKSSIDP